MDTKKFADLLRQLADAVEEPELSRHQRMVNSAEPDSNQMELPLEESGESNETLIEYVDVVPASQIELPLKVGDTKEVYAEEPKAEEPKAEEPEAEEKPKPKRKPKKVKPIKAEELKVKCAQAAKDHDFASVRRILDGRKVDDLTAEGRTEVETKLNALGDADE